MPATLEKEYSVHLDEKNRFSIRGAKTKHWSVKVFRDGHMLIGSGGRRLRRIKHWSVKVFRDGHMLISPQKLVEDPPISAETLRQIKRSIGNLKAGNVSGPIDIKAARRALR